jgi:hypothetical protein
MIFMLSSQLAGGDCRLEAAPAIDYFAAMKTWETPL